MKEYYIVLKISNENIGYFYLQLINLCKSKPCFKKNPKITQKIGKLFHSGGLLELNYGGQKYYMGFIGGAETCYSFYRSAESNH